MILKDISKPADQRSQMSNFVLFLGVLMLQVAVCLPTDARGQVVQGVDTLTLQSTRGYPDLRKGREIILSAVGASLMATSFLVSVDFFEVPPQGLDPTGIRWTVDQDIVGNRSLAASGMSDWTRNVALVFPMALSLTMAQPGERWHGLSHSGLVYAEALLVSQGLTMVGKAAVGRARPFAYLPASDRPDDKRYDVTAERTFFSMPSGHASSAWMAATLGMTTHLLQRPEAGWIERAGIGFFGGALAGATSALRVEAGQHFPSDVLVGAGIGIVSGVAIPLLHRGERRVETNALLQMIGGGVAGTLVGILLAGVY